VIDRFRKVGIVYQGIDSTTRFEGILRQFLPLKGFSLQPAFLAGDFLLAEKKRLGGN